MSWFFKREKRKLQKDSKLKSSKDVLQWDIEDVTNWLKSNGLEECVNTFKSNEITGKDLLEITENDFEDLKITKLGHRKKLKKLIDELRNSKLIPTGIEKSERIFSNSFSDISEASDSSVLSERREGIIKFKCTFKNEHRAFKLIEDHITFEVLKDQIREEFGNSLGHRFTIKYKDQDDDLVTIRKNEDLKIALHNSNGHLRIYIFENYPKKEINTEMNEAMNIFETMVNGVIIMTTDKKIQYFNKSAERMFGYERNEVIGQNVKILMPDPYFSNHDNFVDNYLTTGIKKIIGKGRMVQGKNKFGNCFPIWLSVVETEWEGRRAFTGTLQDLRSENTNKMSGVINILESLVDAVVIMTDDCVIQYFNKSAETLFGYSRNEVIGRNVNIITSDGIKHDKYVEDYLRTGKSRIIGKGRKVIAKKKSGEIFPIWLNLAESKWQGRHAFTATIQDLSNTNLEIAISTL